MPRLSWGPASSAGLALMAVVYFVVAIIVFVEKGLIGFVFIGFSAATAALSYVRARAGR